MGSQARTWGLVVLQEASRDGDVLGPLLGLGPCWVAMCLPPHQLHPQVGAALLLQGWAFVFLLHHSHFDSLSLTHLLVCFSIFPYKWWQWEASGYLPAYKREMKRGHHLHSKRWLWSSEVLFIYQSGHVAVVRTLSHLCSGWGCQQLDAVSLQAPAHCVFWAWQRSCSRCIFATDTIFVLFFFFIFFCVNFWWTHSLIRCKKKPCRSLIFFYFIFFFSLTFSLSFISRCICCLLDSWPGCLAARRPELHQLWDSECEKMVSSPGPAELCYESSNLFLQRWWDVGYHEENALLLFWR